MKEIVQGEECYKIIGACFEVYREKGSSFLESVFQECLELELGLQGIVFESQRALPLTYKGCALRQTYKADFVCYGNILLKIKAVSSLVDEHRAQLLNYFAASRYRLGLLVNFGHHPRLEWERIVR